MFLVDKSKISNLDEIIFNKSLYELYLPKLTKNLQNIILCGYDCSGKKTFANFLLQQIYGDGIKALKEVDYTINNYGSNSVKIKLQQSKFHMILNTNNSAIDKYIIQEIFVEFCKKNDMCYFKCDIPYKCIIINKAEALSHAAQFSLRRVIEEFSNTCRFILICKSSSCLIEPIRHRFLELYLKCPDINESEIILKKVINNEKITIDNNKIKEIVNLSNRNIKRMIVLLECHTLNLNFKCYWNILVDKILDIIIKRKITSLKVILTIREYLSQLFISNLDADVILTYITERLIILIKDNVKLIKIIELLVKYDCNLKNATRYMLHFESLFFNINSVLDD
jgi:DNA polymerase III delta prime subunit